jgi:hypothetical protein
MLFACLFSVLLSFAFCGMEACLAADGPENSIQTNLTSGEQTDKENNPETIHRTNLENIKAEGTPEINPASIPNVAVKNRPLTSKSSVYQATFGESETLEIDMLQWSDGAYSLPIKTIAQLFGFSGQYDQNTKLLKLINPQTQQALQLDLNLESLTDENNKVLFGIENPFKYSPQEAKDGFLVEDDIFVEQGVIEKLFKLKISVSEAEASLTITAEQEVPSGTLVGEVKDWEAGTFVFENPEPMNQLVEKISLGMNSSTNLQETESLNVVAGTPNMSETESWPMALRLELAGRYLVNPISFVPALLGLTTA